MDQGTQFSIYKINFELVENHFTIKKGRNTEDYAIEVIQALLNSVKKIISGKRYSELHELRYGNFEGIVFKTVHEPKWKELAKKCHLIRPRAEQMTESRILSSTIRMFHIYCFIIYKEVFLLVPVDLEVTI